jgi:hypothetical protein
MYKVIYSRLFLDKISLWPDNLKNMALEASEHVALDPSLNDYKRPYLTPYRQKHPTTDHQYTLYFLVISTTEIFFAWINDKSCLHDTRNKLTDPCQKEFDKLIKNGVIETFDQKYHQIVFEIHPDKSKPIRCRSRFLGYETILNTYHDSSTQTYIGHAFYCEESNIDIAKRHVKEFLNELYSSLVASSKKLEIHLEEQSHLHEILLLTESYNHDQWDIVDDQDDFILRRKS